MFQIEICTSRVELHLLGMIIRRSPLLSKPNADPPFHHNVKHSRTHGRNELREQLVSEIESSFSVNPTFSTMHFNGFILLLFNCVS